jgi:hypothetical protein
MDTDPTTDDAADVTETDSRTRSIPPGRPMARRSRLRGQEQQAQRPTAEDVVLHGQELVSARATSYRPRTQSGHSDSCKRPRGDPLQLTVSRVTLP